MYRCHFMYAGQVAQGIHLRVETLDAAIATARKIMADIMDADACDRLEIWLDSALLYEFSTQAGETSPRRSASKYRKQEKASQT
jgi:hypothetical protein